MESVFSGPVDRADIVSRILEHPLGNQATEQRRNFAHLVLGEQTDGARQAAGNLAIEGSDGTIIYFHGGGYAFGSPLTHARIGERLAKLSRLRVLLPSYPLAPEHPWPAQLDSAIGSVQCTADKMRAPIILAGDSAGGHLALVTALELARRGMKVAGLFLFSPNTDRSGLSSTRTKNDSLDPMVDDAVDRRLARQCFGDMPAEHRHLSPVLDDLTLLPPIHIEAGSEEVLLGDSMILAERAKNAGKSVTLHVEADGLHMGQIWAPWWSVANASLERAAAFSCAVIHGNAGV